MQNPRDSGFILISRFLSPGFMENPRDSGFFRDFLASGYTGDFYPRDRDFFRGMGYPDKKPTLLVSSNLGHKISLVFTDQFLNRIATCEVNFFLFNYHFQISKFLRGGLLQVQAIFCEQKKCGKDYICFLGNIENKENFV